MCSKTAPRLEMSAIDHFPTLLRDSYTPATIISRFFDAEDDFWRQDSHFGPMTAGRFDLDFEEQEKQYRLKADLPGVSKEDITVKVEDDILTISSERKAESSGTEAASAPGQDEKSGPGIKKSKFHYQERFYGQAMRSFSLPKDADADNIAAKYENGVLELTIPKQAPIDRTKKITIM